MVQLVVDVVTVTVQIRLPIGVDVEEVLVLIVSVNGNGTVLFQGKVVVQTSEAVLTITWISKGNPIDLVKDISYYFQPIFRKNVTSINPSGTNGNSNYFIVFQRTVSIGTEKDLIVLRTVTGICRELGKDLLPVVSNINP